MNKIQTFNELHFSGELLFLGNAWDLLSALTLEKVGLKAIGTTSWGIANSLGYADGELIDFNRHLEIIKNIAQNVKVPVSADIEAGYGEDTQTIVDHVLRTADVGVAGINNKNLLFFECFFLFFLFFSPSICIPNSRSSQRGSFFPIGM